MKNDTSNKQSGIPFHVMAKPAGPACNLACRYCFYLDKDKFFPDSERYRMPDDVLEEFVRQYSTSQNTPEVNFAWQGGEPTLLGVDFFRKVVDLQQRYAAGKRITNAFQTNATLLDDEWAGFFKEHNFLVGVSIDGPAELHDHFRVDPQGAGSWERVVAGIRRLQAHGAEFNALCCVNAVNSKEPLRVYRCFKELGIEHIQFIPIVERLCNGAEPEEAYVPGPAQRITDGSACELAPWSVEPKCYGTFLNKIFDEWVTQDVGSLFVQQFYVTLGNWVGAGNSICVFSRQCGNAVIIEHNGDIYSCDHYMYPGYRLGNIMTDSLVDMVTSPFQEAFGRFKHESLPSRCRNCDYLFACHGACPKHRFLKTKKGEEHLNYLCSGLHRFFRHVTPAMNGMAELLRRRRSPAEIMRMRKRGKG